MNGGRHCGTKLHGVFSPHQDAARRAAQAHDTDQQLRCGLLVVNLATAALEAMFCFQSGVEEIIAITVLPCWRNPVLIGPDRGLYSSQTVWLLTEQGSSG